ncbi:MAG: hypothetical protein ACJA2S_004965 [Cyclobacteriaceae bacterium]|jgi:hypothetical protein
MKIRKLNSHNNFLKDIEDILIFWKSTSYAFQQTEDLLQFWKSQKLEYDKITDFGHLVSQPKAFNLRKRAKDKRRENLNSMLFVRIISSLEVFLVDLLKDAFEITKEPFKNNELRIDMSHAEILSIKSAKNFYDKIISKECRKLSSAGFDDIVKYYKKHFKIQLSNFSPGLAKMNEYHDIRHLIVHRLGETDSQYRKKYSTTSKTINIEDDYLINAITDLKSYCRMVHDQMVYQIKNEYSESQNSVKKVEKKTFIAVKFQDPIKALVCFSEDFEFWSQDKYYLFKDILDHKQVIDEQTIEYLISGSELQVEDYISVIKREGKKLEFQVSRRKVKADLPKQKRKPNITLDESLLNNIEKKLPSQPWKSGIHKDIASELGVSNKMVNIGIQQLIAQGKYKHQRNGVIIEN